MTLTRWSLVNKLSSLLERDERDAVLGDLVESDASGGQAVRDVLSLIIRRQAALWKDWRPWLALVGLIGLVGVRLSRIFLLLSLAPTIQIQTYWKYGVRYENGLTALEETVALLCQGLSLLAWSWTSGFVLGSLSRRTIWVTGTLYFLVWVYPLPLALYFLARAFLLDSRRPELSPILLMLALQTILRTTLFLLPPISGMRHGLRNLTLSVTQASVLAAASVALTMLSTWTGGWPGAAVVRWSGGAWDASVGWQGRLFSYAVMSWPAGYLLAIAISRRQTKTVHFLRTMT